MLILICVSLLYDDSLLSLLCNLSMYASYYRTIMIVYCIHITYIHHTHTQASALLQEAQSGWASFATVSLEADPRNRSHGEYTVYV